MSKIGIIIFSLFVSFFVSNQLVMAQGESVFGKIEEPVGVAAYNQDAPNNIGLLKFISNMIKITSIVAGVWVMFNFITAGFTYVTSAGDSSAYGKIGEKLSYSVSGLLLIVASYTLAGIVSLIVFGDATYILNPEIPTAIETPVP